MSTSHQFGPRQEKLIETKKDQIVLLKREHKTIPSHTPYIQQSELSQTAQAMDKEFVDILTGENLTSI